MFISAMYIGLLTELTMLVKHTTWGWKCLMMKPIKAPCKRNLMISRPSNYPSLTRRRTPALVITFSLIVIVSLSSCARKPWRDPLNDTERFAVLKTLNEIRNNEALRSNCIDADLNIFLPVISKIAPSAVMFKSCNHPF